MATPVTTTTPGQTLYNAQGQIVNNTPGYSDANLASGSYYSSNPNATQQNTPIDQYMGQQVNNPTLTSGETLTPNLQNPNAAGTNLTNNGQYNITAPNAASGGNITPGQATVTNAQASTVNPNQIPTVGAAGTYNPTLGTAAQGTAAQGQVNQATDTVQGQLAGLYSQFGNGNIPPWAQGAINAANAASNQRGLGQSTIGTTAIAQAIQQQAINIAAPDAATYFQMNLSNLSNNQQMALQNVQFQQQSMLSNQASINAAAQFNASSQQQVDEFNSNLIATIQQQNADRMTAISQFNASSSNTASIQNANLSQSAAQFNQSQLQALNQFNSQLGFQTQQFNAQNAFAIDQSNTLWQRSISTANTAALNAANQTNVQNSFNMSQNALNNLWQEFRDQAAFTFTAQQNQDNRNANAAMIANNEQFVSSLAGNGTAAAVGSFAASLLGLSNQGTTSLPT